jgi:serine protease Do
MFRSRTPSRRGLVPCLAVALCLSLAAAARAQRAELKGGAPVLAAFRDVVAKPSQSTVRIVCDAKEVALGTVVAADGYVVTKASELKGRTVCKFKDGRELEARVVGVDKKHDLAVLQVKAKGLTPVEWRDSKEAAVGNWVASAGTGAEPVAVGVVSVATRRPRPGQLPPARPAANSGFLGVALDNDESAARIARVEPRSPAAKAGLKVDDVVLSIAGKKVLGPERLVNLIQRYKAGDEITIKVKRGDEELELKAKLDKRPAALSRGDFQNAMGSKLSNRRGGFPVVLQHDTVIRPEDCGGPLVDLDGKAVGVNIARAGRTESYAIPSEVVRGLFAEVKAGKLVVNKEDEDD